MTQVIEARVGETPGKVAVTCGEEQLTYEQLNQCANRIAWALTEHGVRPEVLVGLYGERSIDYLTTTLAILKAGGAYLPLDPFYPPKRLVEVIHQSGVRLIITTKNHAQALQASIEELPSTSLVQILLLEEILNEEHPLTNLPITYASHNLAYVMFTSGSTGKPKGVMVEHNGMLNHIYAKIKDLGIGPDDVVAQNGPQSFDISIWQCFAPLVVGARVCIFKDEIAHDPNQLAQQVDRAHISVLQVVPSMLRALLQQIEGLGTDAPTFSSLRWIVPTGDALPSKLCKQWQALFPNVPILNTYGSTECSDDQCHYQVEQDLPADY